MQSFNKLNNKKILRYMDFLKNNSPRHIDSVLVNRPGYHKTKPLTLS